MISKEELDAVMAVKLGETAKKVRLGGFRQGKVPLDIVNRMYGDSLWKESKQQAIDDISRKIIKDEKLAISYNYTTNVIKDGDTGLEFSLECELAPSFELKEVSGIELKRYVAEVTDKEVNEILETVRKENKKWVEDNNLNGIVEGQKVVFDLKIQNTIKKLKNNVLNDLEMIVGDKTIVADYWQHLINTKIGDTKEFSIKYPDTFSDKNLAGKNIKYSITVKKVFNPVEYELDDEFAKFLGHDNLEKAKESAKSHIVSKYKFMSDGIMRRDLLDKLANMYDFDIPKTMATLEGEEVSRQIQIEAARIKKEFTPHIKNECRKIAENRVRLGFVASKIAEAEKISVSKNEISQAIKNIAALYPGQEKEIWQTYTQERALPAIVAPLLEGKVVDFLRDKVKIEDVSCSVEELIALDEEPFDFFKDELIPASESADHQKTNHENKDKESLK